MYTYCFDNETACQLTSDAGGLKCVNDAAGDGKVDDKKSGCSIGADAKENCPTSLASVKCVNDKHKVTTDYDAKNKTCTFTCEKSSNLMHILIIVGAVLLVLFILFMIFRRRGD